MLQTANGFERAVERTINMAVVAQRLTNKIERVFVPVLEGETSVRESSVMPQYIFVRMRMDPKLHFFITNMQYVINFVGADRGGRSASGQMVGNRGFVRPMPMTDEAFEKIVALTRAKTTPTADEGAVGKVDVSSIAIADVVEVCEGPFKGMSGRPHASAHNGASRSSPRRYARVHSKGCRALFSSAARSKARLTSRHSPSYSP